MFFDHLAVLKYIINIGSLVQDVLHSVQLHCNIISVALQASYKLPSDSSILLW